MTDDDKQTKKDQKKAEREAKRAEREKKKKASSDDGGFIAKARQWINDSYNGLFKIVIEPQLPSLRVLRFMLIAFLLGLFWAYVIKPINFYNAAPHQLSSGQRDQYVILVAGSRQANLYDEANTIELLSRVEHPERVVERLIQTTDGNIQASLQQILPLAQQAEPGRGAPGTGSLLADIFWLVVAIIVFILVVNIFAALWALLLRGLIMDAYGMVRPKTEEEKKFAEERAAIKRQREREEELKKAMASEAPTSLGMPITQKVSIYTKGRGYDDSFAIEDANDMFLGETGATVAKAIGDSQELAAIEFWLFDKEDFVRTLTKIFASEHAYNDPAIRSELDTKVDNPATDIVVLAPGATATLETDQLLVEGRILELTPGSVGGLPPNSHFTEMTMQIQAWVKSGAGSSAGGAPVAAAPPPVPAAPAGGLPDLSSYEIGPPPAMPGTPTPQPTQPATPVDYNPAPPPPSMPSSGGLPDLSSYEIGPPPPMPGQDDEEDEDNDPFGGTGDFTPLGRT